MRTNVTMRFIIPMVIGVCLTSSPRAQAPTPIPRVLAPNTNIGSGDAVAERHLNDDPPFAHWDLRQTLNCKVPWSLGPSPVPDVDADSTANTFTDRFLVFTAFEASFAEWEGVTPALIGFTRQPKPSPNSGLAMDSHNSLDFGGDATDDVQVVPVSLAMPAGGLVVDPGPDGVLQTQPAGDDRIVATSIIDGGNGISDTEANNQTPLLLPLAYTGLFMNAKTGQILEADIIFVTGLNWRVNPVPNICDAANHVEVVNVRGTATHEIGHFIGVAHTDMPAVLTRDLADGNTPTMYSALSPPFCNNNFDQTLEDSDKDACNFLYCQDLGDAPDPCAGYNNFPTLISIPGAGPLLNYMRMDGRMLGAGHIFGVKPPQAGHIYVYEWLANYSSQGVDAECRPFQDYPEDEGLTFVPDPPVWGRKMWVFAHVKYATDHDGRFHNYGSKPLYVNTWIDLNQDCIWQEGAEHFIDKVLTPGNFAEKDKVADIGTGGVTILPQFPKKPYNPMWLRARLDYNESVGRAKNIDQTLGLTRGFAQFGEVEDYVFYCQEKCFRIQSTNPNSYASSLNVVLAGNTSYGPSLEYELNASSCRIRLIPPQYRTTSYSSYTNETTVSFGDQSYIPPGMILEAERCQETRDGPQTVLRAYWQPYSGQPTINDFIPTTNSSLGMKLSAQGFPEDLLVRVGCVNDSIGGVIGGRDSSGNWDDSLHVDVHYKIAPISAWPLSTFNPCNIAYFALQPRTYAGSQWINPERPFAFSVPFGAALQPGMCVILEITSHWSVNSNTTTEFVQFPNIFPSRSTPEERQPTVEIAPVIRPNPSNPTASIHYSLPEGARVTLEIFDVGGRLVRRLVSDEQQAQGPHVVEWNGNDDRGTRVSSGVYFCRLQAGSSVFKAKLVVIR